MDKVGVKGHPEKPQITVSFLIFGPHISPAKDVPNSFSREEGNGKANRKIIYLRVTSLQ